MPYMQSPQDEREALSDELNAYCTSQGLEQRCAMELLHEDITEDQRRWLSDFVHRWEAVED